MFLLTGNAGSEVSPALSPDGKQVAYLWDGGRRNFDIYVKAIESANKWISTGGGVCHASELVEPRLPASLFT